MYNKTQIHSFATKTMPGDELRLWLKPVNKYYGI